MMKGHQRKMPMLKISALDDDDFTLRQIGKMLGMAAEKSREAAELVCLAGSGKCVTTSKMIENPVSEKTAGVGIRPGVTTKGEEHSHGGRGR